MALSDGSDPLEQNNAPCNTTKMVQEWAEEHDKKAQGASLALRLPTLDRRETQLMWNPDKEDETDSRVVKDPRKASIVLVIWQLI